MFLFVSEDLIYLNLYGYQEVLLASPDWQVCPKCKPRMYAANCIYEFCLMRVWGPKHSPNKVSSSEGQCVGFFGSLFQVKTF